MPQTFSYPEPETSENAHQEYEDARSKGVFHLFTSPPQVSSPLENGAENRASDTKQEQAVRDNAVQAALKPDALHEETSNWIPYSTLASHHLPAYGPLRIRNDVEEPAQDPGFGPPHRSESEHSTIIFKERGEAETQEDLQDLPEISDTESQHTQPPIFQRASERIAEIAKDKLFYPIRERDDRTKTKKYVLNMAAMQAAEVRYYQMKIADSGRAMCNGTMYADQPELLHRYCDALRDLDYMQEKARNGFDHDPFLLMTTKQMEREMMFASGLIADEEMEIGLPPALDEKNPTLPGVGRTARLHATEARARSINILCALLGGLALIVPMVIMTLVPSRMSVLVVTCSFVLVFALVIALLSGLKPHEVLAVTAGYAAVLVVFVGAQTGSIGSSFTS